MRSMPLDCVIRCESRKVRLIFAHRCILPHSELFRLRVPDNAYIGLKIPIFGPRYDGPAAAPRPVYRRFEIDLAGNEPRIEKKIRPG